MTYITENNPPPTHVWLLVLARMSGYEHYYWVYAEDRWHQWGYSDWVWDTRHGKSFRLGEEHLGFVDHYLSCAPYTNGKLASPLHMDDAVFLNSIIEKQMHRQDFYFPEGFWERNSPIHATKGAS